MTADGRVKGKHCSRPFVIGITGPIAAGKSTVASILRDAGADVIDADEVYHALVRPGTALQRSIVNRFGSSVVGPDGELDRRRLGELVFSDAEALRDLDALTHPAIVAAVRGRIGRSSAPVVAMEAVKLVQAGLAGDVDEIWLVVADLAARAARLSARTGWDAAAAAARVAAASPGLPAGIVPDRIIDNSADLASTRTAVAAALDDVRTLKCGVLHAKEDQ
jgi:dephospho-CoA kinase